MASDHVVRAQLVGVQVQRLMAEASRCNDLARLDAIRAEMEVLQDSLLDIRAEQLQEQLGGPPKRRWWRRRSAMIPPRLDVGGEGR